MVAQAEMEDIISSIRTTLAEETAKVSGSAPEAAKADEEEILELTPEEMVGAAPAAGGEDLVDISAFAASGVEQPASAVATSADDLLGEAPVAAPAPAPAKAAPVAAPAAGGEADEFDKLLNQISAEQQKQIAAAEEQKQALLAEEEPLDALEAPAAAEAALEAPAAAPAAQPVNGGANGTVNGNGHHTMVASAMGGSQIAFPAEVLAMALRPMVQEWLQANLPGVVEKLVKDEIGKLNQG